MRRWDLDSLAALEPPLPTLNKANAVAVSSDGANVVAASAGGLQIWKLEAGEPPSLLARRRIRGIADIAATSDASMLALVGDDGSVRLMRAARLKPAGTLIGDRDGASTSVAFAPGDGTLASAVRGEPRIQLWSTRSATPRLSLPTEGADVFDLALGAPTVVAATGSGLAVWDRRSPQPPATVPLDGKVTAVALDGSHNRVAVGSDEVVIRLLGLRRPHHDVELLRAHTGAVASHAFLADGEWLASAATDGTTRLWNTAAPSAMGVSEPLDGGADVRSGAHLGLNADGTRLAAVAPDGRVVTWDATSARRLTHTRIPHARAAGVALDDTGTVIAMAGFENPGVTLWDVDRRRLIPSAPFVPQPSTSIAIGPHDRLVAVGGADGVVRLWDRAWRRVEPARPRMPDDWVDALAFDRNGRVLAAAAGRWVRIWQLDSPGSQHMDLDAGVAQRTLAFSPDGRMLASASGTEVRLWDAASGLPLGEPLRAPGSHVAGLAVGDRGLVSVDHAMRLTRWDPLLATDGARAWSNRLCRAVGRGLSAQEWKDVLSDMPYRPACA